MRSSTRLLAFAPLLACGSEPKGTASVEPTASSSVAVPAEPPSVPSHAPGPAPTTEPAPNTPPGPNALLVVEDAAKGCVLRVRDGARAWLLSAVDLCGREARYAASPDGSRLLAHFATAERETVLLVDVGGGVRTLPTLPGVAAIAWSAEGVPLAATVDDTTGAGHVWKLHDGTSWGWGTPFEVEAGSGRPSVPKGRMRTWALPSEIRAALGAPADEGTPATLTEGGPGAGWRTDGEVAVQAGGGEGVGPVAIRLTDGAWAQPDVLRGVSPVTWQRSGELLFVRRHGARLPGTGHLANPDAPQGTWVFERARGGVVYTTRYAVARWPSAAVPPLEPECPAGASMQVVEPGAFSPPLFPDCRPPGTPDWPVSERFARDYPLDVRSGDRVSACVDGTGAVVGAYVFERAVPDGKVVVRGVADGSRRTLALETPDGLPILLAEGTQRTQSAASFSWMCAADERVFCPCGAVEASFVHGELAAWRGRRGDRELALDLGEHADEE